jgi:hypothetical protein
MISVTVIAIKMLNIKLGYGYFNTYKIFPSMHWEGNGSRREAKA